MATTTQALTYARNEYIKQGVSHIFDKCRDMIYKGVLFPNLTITGTDPGRQMYPQYTTTAVGSGKQLQGMQLKATWAGTSASLNGGITGIEIKARADSDSVARARLGQARAIVGNVDAKKTRFTNGYAFEAAIDIASGGTIDKAAGFRSFLNNSGTATASYAFLVESETAGPWGYGFYSASGEATVGMFLGGTQKIEFYDDGIYIQSSANGKLKLSADGSGTDDITLSGTVTVDDAITGPFTDSAQVYFVDIGQTASSESGKRGDPYKTIQGAVDAIAALADNSDTKGYVIMVAPGVYTETLTLEDDALYNLAFIAMGGPWGVVMDPAGGDALESEVDNEHLHYLYFKGFRFKGSIDFDGEENNTKFLFNDGVFEDCRFDEDNESKTIDVKNANRFWWKNGSIHVLSDVAFENVHSAGISGESYRDLFYLVGAPGDTTVVANTGNDTPYSMRDANGGGDQCTLWYKDVFCQRKEPALTATAGVPILRVVNSYCGLGMGLTIASSADLYAYNAVFPGAVTINSGGTIFWYNSVAVGTLTDNASGAESHFYGDDTS